MNQYEEVVLKLKTKGVLFDRGMSLSEINDTEKLYDISFPVELKHLFSVGLPVSKSFCNWRNTQEENVQRIKDLLDMPIQGLIFDLETNDFWCDDWGEKPIDIRDARCILLEKYNEAPPMIPIYGHRYIPFVPNEIDIPVFSIMQSDIIYYGTDLISYLEIEFDFKQYSELVQEKIRHVDFWSDLL
jgi:hypothetical protein